MLIGSWGSNIIFEVSGEIAKTFKELTEKSSGRWAEHETINSRPLSQFLGPGLDELEISIIFSLMLGVKPQESYEDLRTAVRRGEYNPFIMGGYPLSGNFWRIDEVSGSSTLFGPRDGKVMWMECSITLKEYN